MMLVKTHLDKSVIHGIGLFASEAIKSGTVVWQYQPPFDRKWCTAYVASLPQVAREFVTHFCAKLRDGSYLVTGDNDRFFNHSPNPNCNTGELVVSTIALRDIAAGEEMTENYFSYCDEI